MFVSSFAETWDRNKFYVNNSDLNIPKGIYFGCKDNYFVTSIYVYVIHYPIFCH